MTKKHLIHHENKEIALELNVQHFMESEMNRMNSSKYAVEMKELN